MTDAAAPINDPAAYVRMRTASDIFKCEQGDIVRVGRFIAEQLIATGHAEAAPSQLYTGRRLRPGSLVVE